jgi:hypothetical protein
MQSRSWKSWNRPQDLLFLLLVSILDKIFAPIFIGEPIISSLKHDLYPLMISIYMLDILFLTLIQGISVFVLMLLKPKNIISNFRRPCRRFEFLNNSSFNISNHIGHRTILSHELIRVYPAYLSIGSHRFWVLWLPWLGFPFPEVPV